MSNDEVYAAGLLNRALDLATQPPEIQAFLRVELDLLLDVITEGMRVIDVGCGTGRHLLQLRDRLRLGVGVDYEHSYIAEADRRAGGRHLRAPVAHSLRRAWRQGPARPLHGRVAHAGEAPMNPRNIGEWTVTGRRGRGFDMGRLVPADSGATFAAAVRVSFPSL